MRKSTYGSNIDSQSKSELAIIWINLHSWTVESCDLTLLRDNRFLRILNFSHGENLLTLLRKLFIHEHLSSCGHHLVKFKFGFDSLRFQFLILLYSLCLEHQVLNHIGHSKQLELLVVSESGLKLCSLRKATSLFCPPEVVFLIGVWNLALVHHRHALLINLTILL